VNYLHQNHTSLSKVITLFGQTLGMLLEKPSLGI